jgi:hypothetical protein
LTSEGALYLRSDNGALERRDSGEAWKTLSKDSIRFEVNAAGRHYVLETNGWVSVNSCQTWANVADFALGEDQSFYCLNNTGSLERLCQNGQWQNCGTNVVKFAVRDDGATYTLGSDGVVRLNGVATWSNISNLSIDAVGNLKIEGPGGTTDQVLGRFIKGERNSGQANTVAGQSKPALAGTGRSGNTFAAVAENSTQADLVTVSGREFQIAWSASHVEIDVLQSSHFAAAGIFNFSTPDTGGWADNGSLDSDRFLTQDEEFGVDSVELINLQELVDEMAKATADVNSATSVSDAEVVDQLFTYFGSN